MTRIIAGAAKGRRLRVPEGDVTRPTSDRVREAMFSTLESMLGPMDGLAVADLYAGSGALGLEALSRGAASCVFVERDPRVLRVLRANVVTTGLPGAVVHAGEVDRVLGERAGRPVDLALLDPPYAQPASELVHTLARLLEHGWLADEAVVVIERPWREPEPAWPDGLRVARERRYGETRLWYVRQPCVAAPAPDPSTR